MSSAGSAPNIFRDPNQTLEARVEDLLGRLTLEEKISLMAGATAFELQAIERLGVPQIRMTDGPTGVRSQEGVPATVFPVGVAIAATWNPDTAEEVGAAIAREARALGKHVLLAPTINIVRTPTWGRNFETYSEDPYLTARVAIAYVNGVQSEGVGTSLKHFAVNNQERNRLRVSAEVDERTLREIYLAAFETVVKRARPWTVMASYNRINGTYATENRRLLTDILKREWNYDGVVVSDWGAVHSTAPAANAGTDLEMPGPAFHYGRNLARTVREWSVTEAQIDDSARRLVRLVIRTGVLDGRPQPPGEVATARHREIALRAAEESIVLLKNDDSVLPFDLAKLKSIAVIGPNADVSRVQGGGSSHVPPSRRVTPLAAIRALIDGRAEVFYAQGVDHEPTPPPARAEHLSTTRSREQQGLLVEYFADASLGAPIRSEVEHRFAKRLGGEKFAALRWSGFFWPPKDGSYEFSVRAPGEATLELDGKQVLDSQTFVSPDPRDVFGISVGRRTISTALRANDPIALKFEYVCEGGRFESVSVGIRVPAGSIDEACEVARRADAAIVVVGSASSTEAEGYDRSGIELPGAQDELVTAVLGANPRTAVVVNSGSAIAMPWIDRARAVVAAWLPGQEGPHAIADVLFGRCVPSGKLPVTFPRRTQDDPAYLHLPGGRRSFYGEGLFVGYRYFDRKQIEPLFPFGHGISYTTFAYSDLEVPSETHIGQSVSIGLTVRNAGARGGKEVVQLYIAPLVPLEPGPVKALKAFRKVALKAGESQRVELILGPRDFARYDVDRSDWVVDPGDYQILVGASSADIRLRAVLKVLL